MSSRQRPKILLLGSAPYAGLQRNPAAEIVDHFVREGSPVADIVGAILPVSFARLPKLIPALVEEHEPDIGLGMGLFVGAASVRIETTALNIVDFDVADNDGRFIRNTRIDPDGPAARSATCDAAALAAKLRSISVPASVSHHAGTHLCNLTLYCLLAAAKARGRGGMFGFVHLPLLPEQAAELIDAGTRHEPTAAQPAIEYPSMDFATQTRAIAGLVDALAAETTATPRPKIMENRAERAGVTPRA